MIEEIYISTDVEANGPTRRKQAVAKILIVSYWPI